MDDQGRPIPTTEPHWIDHIPVGFYVLEETICPYEQGYVQSVSVNIDVLETGNVQSFEMEDDFTALEIRKYDTKNEDVIYEDSEAYLTLTMRNWTRKDIRSSRMVSHSMMNLGRYLHSGQQRIKMDRM